MTDTSNYLGPVKFKKSFSYAKRVPTFVNNNVGGSDEIARWVLDWNDVLYKDEPHAPYLSNQVFNALTGEKRAANSPVLINTDALVYTTGSIVQYLEQRAISSKKLLPDDLQKKQEVLELYKLFTGSFEENVTKYFYSRLLPNPQFAQALIRQRIPRHERYRYKEKFDTLSAALTTELKLSESSPEERLDEIKKVFNQVDRILSDGRRYLAGEKLTLADIAFASVAAPLVLPEECGGAMSTMSQVPDDYRRDINAFRTTAAGQFVMLLYQEERPTARPQSEIPKEPGLLERVVKKVQGGNKANLFYFLQQRFPILKIPFTSFVAVNRHDLLMELFDRDLDFTVEEINSKKMADQGGAFFLGLDRMNPQFDRERNFVRRSTHREDLELIRSYIRTWSDEIIQNAQPYGKLDVANTLNYPVLVRLIDIYFGVPAPTEAKMKWWLRALFYDLFLNFTNNKAKHQEAVDAANERKAWILELIEDRKQELKDGKTLADNVLNRLILLQQEAGNHWFDDDTLHRNIGGLITGILETTNKAVILVLDELFKRPNALKGAIETAHQQDMKKMYAYVSEALRFNPAQPGVLRFSENQQVLTGKGSKGYIIPAKSKIFALTSCAMFDPAAFPDPKKFSADRQSRYMNYGFGLHECYGRYINEVTISELVAAVLRLKNVQREPGSAGEGTGLHTGPFFNNFVVRFS